MIRSPRLRRAACALFAAAAVASPLPNRALAEAIVDGSEVTFRLDARKWKVKPKRVNVVGSFQGWSKDATPLKDGGKGVWEAKVHVAAAGPQTYKFLVDGERFLTDETGKKTLETDDGFGGKNSGFAVGGAASPAGATPDAAAATDADTVFTLDTSSWEQQPKSLAVAGDFNGWNKTATPMTANGNVWTASAKLPAGVAHYKFVADGDRWLVDPRADQALDADDGNGGKNSGVRVGAVGESTKKATVAANDKGFEFSFDASNVSPKPTKVNLAGDFNGWSTDATPMTRAGDVWSVKVAIPEGNHSYKFVIDGKWTPDPKADPALDNDDGNGGHNSGVVVGPDARKMPPPEPNAVKADAILFDPTSASDLNVVGDRELRFRLRAQDGDAEHIYVLSSISPTMQDAQRTELRRLGAQLGYASYGGTLRVSEEMAGKTIHYAFELTDGTADVRWAGKALEGAKTFIAASMRVELKPTFITPAWAENAVWYQIFPERFKNGDTANDPANSPIEHMVAWTSKWFDAQPGEKPGIENFYDGNGEVWKRRYGGDVQGLKQSLPYLKSLGITAIYLNPVFEAESMHKYDTTDYRHIDDNFGVKGDWPVAGETEDPKTWKWSKSDLVFLDFVAEAHKQGIKVVLDGVFNHVGRPCPFFQDVLERGKKSPYADWFEITDWGDEANWKKMADPFAVHGKPGGIQWKAWDGANGFLPAFKKNDATGLGAGPMKLIDDISTRWLAPDGDASRGVDGFRLDAANEVPHPFWVQWRDVVKKAKPDAYITGEIWSPAQSWINDGKQFDAVMNYQFAMPTLDFFANRAKATKPSAYASRLTEVVYMYPQQASRVMMNLFNSHDTDRMASMFVNPDRAYDSGNRLQEAIAKDYSSRKPNASERQRQMQAVAMQMSFLGAPMIYYGDEAGMYSADDPSDRQPMTWPGLKFADPDVGFDQKIFDGFQRLIAIRNTLPALKDGDFWPLVADDAAGTLAFARGDAKQNAYVVFNRSEKEATIDVPVVAADAGATLINWTDASQATLNAVGGANDRPMLAATGKAGIAVKGGIAHVTLPPYGSAILSAAPR